MACISLFGTVRCRVSFRFPNQMTLSRNNNDYNIPFPVIKTQLTYGGSGRTVAVRNDRRHEGLEPMLFVSKSHKNDHLAKTVQYRQLPAI